MPGPILEVVSAAASGDARRLTTVAKVKAALRITDSANDALITSIIDGVSADCARQAKLARAGATEPTFGRETLRATWRYDGTGCLANPLLLPWRVPIISIASVTADGDLLGADTDYRLGFAAGSIERVSEGYAIDWLRADTIIEFTAGWELPDDVPAGLEMRVIDQVKMQYLGTKRDPSIRSESVPEVYQASYGVIGGDSIGESGLLKSLETALAPYTGWSI